MNLFEVPQPSVPVAGEDGTFPVHRIYCVGRNYAAHAREMGHDPQRTAPVFFMKPADAIVHSGATVRYPSRTKNFQHEIELVVAIAESGRDIAVADALGHVFGYAVGIDLTRRDLQIAAKENRVTWDTAKGFDQSAPISALHRVADVGHPDSGRIWLSVNDVIRQNADLNELIWSVPEAIVELSTFFTLVPGDLIFTGTPAGVGPIEVGDEVTGGIDGIDEIAITIA
ncbi:MAG: fumarylacetoacetate hydrolase family protein [Gammaproteobacteria bacterium]|nr:fumarylacetoacetate hydrolase family protein [Gammaproteobacteria bacterium]